MKTIRSMFIAVVATVAAAGVISGCGSSSKSSAAGDGATTTTAPTPFAVSVTAGDYAFQDLPDTLPAGIVHMTFHNAGQVDHEMIFLKVAPGTESKTVTDSLTKIITEGAPFPAALLAANGVPETAAGQTTVSDFNLTPGDYLVLCTLTGEAGSKKDGAPHFARGMSKKITVTGSGGTAVPTAASSIVARDYSFQLNGLKAGEQTIAFSNSGPTQWHFAEILGFAKGVTTAQAEADLPKLLASQGPPPAGITPPDNIAGSQLASPGYGNTFTAKLESGRTYAVICFVSDKTGGPPHAIAHKMYKTFTVS